MNINFRLMFRVAIVWTLPVSIAVAEYNLWGLEQPVNWQNLDTRCTDAGNVRIDRVTATSRGGSALVSYFYPEDGGGCPKDASQQFLYRWDFDRDVSIVSGKTGDTVAVATLGIDSVTQPPANCPRLNPFMSISSDISDDFASSIGGEARFYADPSHPFHVSGPRTFKISNPSWPDAGIRVSLQTPGGAGRCIDLRIIYTFKSGASNLSDCLFNWKEAVAPYLFAPATRVNGNVSGYTYRYYSATNTYLGTHSDGNVYLYAPALFGDKITNIGTMAYYANLAGCR